ncbi:MAG TPA: hypothetical protein VFX97_05560 [Pyrinomonadaceae bacterium]|nr:hypothetical protein [Pyrinomonadaceae bacterium]
MPLAGQVSVRTMDEERVALVFLQPNSQPGDLSRLYDQASAAAVLSQGMLFVGQNRTFIRYRDADAPRGYDAEAIEPPRGNDLYLVDRDGTHTLSAARMQEVDLAQILLRIPPVTTHRPMQPATIFVVALAGLCDMLVNYFQDHHLRFRVARLENPGNKTLVLLEVSPRPDSPTGDRVPPFVLSYLLGLPHTTVFTSVEEAPDRNVLVQWRHQYPCLPRHIIDVFAADTLVFFSAGSYFSNTCVSPIPPFFEGDNLTSVKLMGPAETTLRPISDLPARKFELPVRLLPDSGPLSSTAALVLKLDEIEWVRRLLHRLPGEIFADYRICLGVDCAVLMGTAMKFESLPFGVPFRQVQDTSLFIPVRSRFVPDLPWSLLSQVLQIKEETYTFFAQEFRLDVPRNAFTLLSRSLFAQTNPSTLKFELARKRELPKLNWTSPPRPERVSAFASAREQIRGLRDSTFGRGASWRSDRHADQRTSQSVFRPVTQDNNLNAENLFRGRAEEYQKAGDYLSAAMCFALAGDKFNAAQNYQAAARELESGPRDKPIPISIHGLGTDTA